MKPTVVLAITGASGAIYAERLLEVLIAAGWDVHLTISPAGRLVLKQELDVTVDLDDFQISSLLLSADANPSDSKLDLMRSAAGISTEESSVLSFGKGDSGEVHYHHYQDFMAPIASGSFLTDAMVICPCSGTTLGAIVHGLSTNLIHRAADVHLKERRRLIIVPRETPISSIHLDNLKRAADAGAVVLPAMPGFYHGVKTIRDLVDFVVGRICDQLGIKHTLMRRWGD
jgi:4-hydroxy-3-polyprenylbenzoate decarboxylase